jgi:hypothetical protein
MSDLSGKYKVYLGGRERGLRYTLEDRERLEGMFPRPDGTPNDLPTIVQNHMVGSGAFSVQAALLWKGLHTVDKRIQLGKVKEWLQKEVDASKGETNPLQPVFRAVFNAIFESGVLGVVIKDALAEAEDGDESPKEEKKQTPPKS